MQKIFLLFIVILISTCIKAQVFTVDSVPDPKQFGGGYVSDPSNILQPATIAEINTLLTNLENKTTSQVALVVLPSIGYEVPKDFAYKLFNKWGIGVKGKNNGLLMLMVMDQRRIEFETGYGMEAVLPDATCKRIQMNYMVPRFKVDEYDAGLLEGIKATVDILQNKENSDYFNEMELIENYVDPEEKQQSTGIAFIVFMIVATIVYFVKRSNKSFKELYHQAFPDQKKKITLVISQKRWVVLYVLIPSLIFGYIFFFYYTNDYHIVLGKLIYLYFIFIFIEKRIRSNAWYKSMLKEKDYYENYKKYTKAHEYWFWTAFIFPIPFLFYIIYYLIQKHKLRNHPRDCRSCSSPLLKLDEVADDTHLSKAQLMEEQLNSVDYDVWFCTTCSAKQVLSYKNVFSKYSECKKCKTKAYYLYSNVTLVSPTYESSGTGQKTYKCKYCGHVNTETYSIAKLQRSSSSSSSSSYSGGGGGSSSWGGGSSGGGGSGSSW